VACGWVFCWAGGVPNPSPAQTQTLCDGSASWVAYVAQSSACCGQIAPEMDLALRKGIYLAIRGDCMAYGSSSSSSKVVSKKLSENEARALVSSLRVSEMLALNDEPAAMGPQSFFFLGGTRRTLAQASAKPGSNQALAKEAFATELTAAVTSWERVEQDVWYTVLEGKDVATAGNLPMWPLAAPLKSVSAAFANVHKAEGVEADRLRELRALGADGRFYANADPNGYGSKGIVPLRDETGKLYLCTSVDAMPFDGPSGPASF
jgi:hypothetical protein